MCRIFANSYLLFSTFVYTIFLFLWVMKMIWWTNISITWNIYLRSEMVLGDGQYAEDDYVTIIVYLHETTVYQCSKTHSCSCSYTRFSVDRSFCQICQNCIRAEKNSAKKKLPLTGLELSTLGLTLLFTSCLSCLTPVLDPFLEKLRF